MKINNHFLPVFHIKKWRDIGGKLYVKNTDKIRNLSRYDFSKKKYYSTDGTDSLENRISEFERYISDIIKTVDNEESAVILTGKQLYLLKLYCAFCSYRHQFTSEVITEDDFGIYKSNNYIWGVQRFTEKKEILHMTEEIIKVFETIKDDIQFTHLESFENILPSEKMLKIGNPTLALYGLHLSIIRSADNWFCISDRCAIIENTLDSDYLFTYVPVSPKTALLLVKTKYYMDLENYNYSRKRLASKNGGYCDPYLSVIFGSTGKRNYDDALFCTYYKPFIKSAVHLKETLLPNDDYSNVTIKINQVPKIIADNFNSIFYQDGNKFIFIDNIQLSIAKNLITEYRHITAG